MKVELNEESIKHINRLLQSLPISTFDIVKEITDVINKGLVEEIIVFNESFILIYCRAFK